MTKFFRYAPIEFCLGGSIANHAILEAAHFNRQLAKLGRMRDKARGTIRGEALNDALRVMMAPRKFTVIEMGDSGPPLPTIDRRGAP